jgi:selenophosphate synthetase-related protein
MGFEPMLLSDGLSVEMEDTGKKIIEGFQKSINQLKHSKVHLTGSTEENMKTVQTSIGVTGIGIVSKDKLKYKKSSAGDLCVAIGLPLVGYEVLHNLDKVMSVEDFEKIGRLDYINEIIPVGSKGAGYEISELCSCNNLKIKYKEDLSYNINCSGGPSCSCVLSIKEKDFDLLKVQIDKPIEILGTFIL